MNHLQDLQEENCKLRSELTALTASVEEKDRELAIANGMLTFMRDVQDTNADLRAQLAAATKRAEEAERAETELKSQLRLCEEHAGSMAKDFDASIAAAQSERDQALARVAVMAKTVGFFASVIKCAEPWTRDCQKALDAALAARKTDTEEKP
jgi:chromosome segregation ATPase